VAGSWLRTGNSTAWRSRSANLVRSGALPFKAERRHQYWSADIRYIEEHLLPDPKPVYVITIFENFSRMVLSSAISATQTQWDFLSVLANAIQRYGAPEALVTDGGGQFYSTVAVQLYDMLGIRKERIDPGQPWENYAETLFSIQRRLGDYAFSNARTWPETTRPIRPGGRTTMWSTITPIGSARTGDTARKRCYVECWGAPSRDLVLSRALYATQFTRQIDTSGYVKFKHWKFFGENGLPAGEEVSVWVYENTRDP